MTNEPEEIEVDESFGIVVDYFGLSNDFEFVEYEDLFDEDGKFKEI